MKISSEIINDYASHIQKCKSCITDELITKNSEIMSKTISSKIAEYIESLKGVQNINELDVKEKIKGLVFEYFCIYTEVLVDQINKKENSFSRSVTKTNDEYEIDRDSLLYEFKPMSDDIDEEKLNSIISKIIDKTITHINFVNRNNLEYRNYEVEIEKEIEKIIKEKIETKSKEVDEDKFNLKNSIDNQDSMLMNYLTNDKTQSIDKSNLENLFDEKEANKTK